MTISRRNFIKKSSKALALTAIPIPLLTRCASDPLNELDANSPSESSEHFYLQIIAPGGADPIYMFDSRPLQMKEDGLQSNYGEAPTLWEGANGTATWASPHFKALHEYRDEFSIINGIHMSDTFDGHDQNLNFYLSGNPFGGEIFLPHLNTDFPLDYLQIGSAFFSVSNGSKALQLSSSSGRALGDLVRTAPSLDPSNPLNRFIASRFNAHSEGRGLFRQGVRRMDEGFRASPDIAKRLKRTRPTQQGDPDLSNLEVIKEYFKNGIARSALLVVNPDPVGLGFDTHAGTAAMEQPALYERYAETLAKIIKYLKETPFSPTSSLLDVTTFTITTEFGRTMRQRTATIDTTGTDHNPLSSQLLIGGKGIRKACVFGQSDFRTSKEELSGAHLEQDRDRLKVMGRPFDFTSMKPADNKPETYDKSDYLLIGSVVNTIYKMFGIDESLYRTYGRNPKVSPTLDGLLLRS